MRLIKNTGNDRVIDELRSCLMPQSSKLPEVLDQSQKINKIKNLLQAMRRDNLIHPEGSRSTAIWRLVPSKS